MANVRIKAAIERISNDIDKTVKAAVMYSGVEKKDAISVGNTASEIIQQAARLLGLARIAEGYQPGEDEKLVKKIRKALGYTYP
jgi:hypothetical protein